MINMIRLLGVFCFLFNLLAFGQMNEYGFKRELKGVSDTWHSVELPDSIFRNVSGSLSDIRILGITPNHDTIEVPYVLQLSTNKAFQRPVVFRFLNYSYNQLGHFFTLETSTNELISEIAFDFEQKNYDWKVRLEGSQDQIDWFTILDNERILSIRNEDVDFQFNDLTFSSSNYRYYRLLVQSRERPKLKSASLKRTQSLNAKLKSYNVQHLEIIENARLKQTEVYLELRMPVPLSYVNIEVKDDFDYYRPIDIKYLKDSVKSDKGWVFNYSTLTTGILNSFESKPFEFASTTVEKLKITIYNQDNQPLSIGGIALLGEVHILKARFTEAATYYLVYGRDDDVRPSYDLSHFESNIPNATTKLVLGPEMLINGEEVSVNAPLFKHKIWLWLVMGFIAVVMVWSTFKMIKKASVE